MPENETPAPKAKKPRAKRATKAEKETRVNKVFDLLVQGLTRYQIMQFAATKTDWKLQTRQLDEYIAEASAMIAQEAAYLRPKEVGKAIARLNAIFQGAVKVMDFKTAIAAQRELNHLLSLYEPPAPQTFVLRGNEADLLAELVARIQAQGMKPSDLFNSMLSIIAAEKKTNE